LNLRGTNIARKSMTGRTPSRAVEKFHAKLLCDFVRGLGPSAYHIFKAPAESLTYVELRKFHMAKLCYYFASEGLYDFVLNLVNYPQILRFNSELHYFTGNSARVQ
jgi:hypothetical protein